MSIESSKDVKFGAADAISFRAKILNSRKLSEDGFPNGFPYGFPHLPDLRAFKVTK